MRRDPRDTQIAILSLLLIIGLNFRSIGVGAPQILVSVAVTLSTQALAIWLSQRASVGFSFFDQFEWRSALITAFSLSILLRVDHLLWAALAACIAITSKFLIRIDTRHVFNPANFAIIVLLVCSNSVWVSPGQWGTELLLLIGLTVLAAAVLLQTRQWDIAAIFLLVFGGLLMARAYYLGDPVAIPLHQLGSAALLIFSFFMLSDPKTIPPTLAGRAVFAVAVAGVAFGLRFYAFVDEAIFYALFSVCGVYGVYRLYRIKGRHYEVVRS